MVVLLRNRSLFRCGIGIDQPPALFPRRERRTRSPGVFSSENGAGALLVYGVAAAASVWAWCTRLRTCAISPWLRIGTCVVWVSVPEITVTST